MVKLKRYISMTTKTEAYVDVYINVYTLRRKSFVIVAIDAFA